MILTLAVDDAHRLLTVLAEGPIGFAEISGHLLHERTRGALGYRELIDARRATPALSSNEVRLVVALMRSDAAHGALGPTAVVVSSDVAYGMLRMLGTLVEDVAAVRPFRDYHEAVQWLASAAAGPEDGSALRQAGG